MIFFRFFDNMSNGTQVMILTILKKVEINYETENIVSKTNFDIVITAIQSNARCCTNPVF